MTARQVELKQAANVAHGGACEWMRRWKEEGTLEAWRQVVQWVETYYAAKRGR